MQASETSHRDDYPPPGQWFLHLEHLVVDEVEGVEEIPCDRGISPGIAVRTRGGHTFTWRREKFQMLMAHEVGFYVDAVKRISDVVAGATSSFGSGGIAFPMARTLIVSALRAQLAALQASLPEAA